jgi:alpha 1,3-glucosidase
MFYQLGAFYPFMRGHSHIESLKREPYLQTPLIQKTIKDAVFLRYELMHVLYTLFYTASQDGLPIMRPMWYEFPDDATTFAMAD